MKLFISALRRTVYIWENTFTIYSCKLRESCMYFCNTAVLLNGTLQVLHG